MKNNIEKNGKQKLKQILAIINGINGNNHTNVESHYRHKIQAILIDNIQSTFLLININKYYPLKLLWMNFDR